MMYSASLVTSCREEVAVSNTEEILNQLVQMTKQVMEVHLKMSALSLSPHWKAQKPQERIHGRCMTEHVVAHTVSLYFSLCVCSKPRRLGSSFGPQSRGQEGVSQVPQTLHLVCPGKNCWEVDPLLNTQVTRNPRDSLYYHWESNTFKKNIYYEVNLRVISLQI